MKLRRLSPDDRLDAAHPFKGRRVELRLVANGGPRTITGELVELAHSWSGVSDVLVIRRDCDEPGMRYRYCDAIGVATVERLVDLGELDRRAELVAEAERRIGGRS